jgi:AAA+ ATPase superfamily predicted ATPase
VCSAATNRKTLIKTSLRRGFLFSDLPHKKLLDERGFLFGFDVATDCLSRYV